MCMSTRLVTALLLASSLLIAVQVRAEDVGQPAATAAELKTLLEKSDVSAIRLTADIDLAEPLAIRRNVRIDGQRDQAESFTLTGDLIIKSRRVRLANLRLNGVISFEGAVRMDMENVMANRVSRGPITFHFDNYYPIGFFANGDYWARGPLTLTR